MNAISSLVNYLPSKDSILEWKDGHTAIGQCIANATEAIDVLRCDPHLSSLPAKYDPYGLCYQPYEYKIYAITWDRIKKQLYSEDLFELLTNQTIKLAFACLEHRRNCSEIFEGTKESALRAAECLKPHFGNMFRGENDTAVQNLCRIALNSFRSARGLLEIDLFTRGLSLFDKECFQLEPLELSPPDLPFLYPENESNPFLITPIVLLGLFGVSFAIHQLQKNSSPKVKKLNSHE